MLTQAVLVVAGLAILLVAGDLLVRGAVALASALKIPTLIISLTIVAFGTSAPELVVTVQAVIIGNDGIALGNIIGSNIANILLVLGLPAIIYPVSTHVPGLRRHAFVMMIATGAFAIAAYGPGEINTRIGWGLFASIILYVGYMSVRAMRGDYNEPVIDEVEEYLAEDKISLKTIAFVAAGLIGLPLGANLLVINGSALAAGLGVREELIGLTIIAFGTSLPELATVVAAAVHKKSDVAIGGIIGSNIFNIFAVGGAAGLAGTAIFEDASRQLDIPVMIASTVLLAAFVFMRTDIARISGGAMAAAYFGFIYFLAITAGVV
ncbi:MAG: calcium/sodium antiporter [Pseudomonadota bacterium]